MKPLQASSGDVLADRRAGYAEMLFSSGDHAAAADLMRDALDLSPGWALGWFRLGEMREAAGALDAAAEAWTTALELDPRDRSGAALKLAVIGRAPSAETSSSAFVEALFDQYADTFDAALVEKLAYRVPALLSDAVHMQRRGTFRLALDLGCGTGLMGEVLRPHVERLEGFDISARMLAKARARAIYDRLEKADLQDFRYEGGRPDLIVAADVLIYLGALERVAKTVAGLLSPGGLFAFSVERLAGEGDFALQPSRRYAHSEPYVRRLLGENGLDVLWLEEHVLRLDRGEPVVGLIVMASFPPP
ncbi:class I SAM-dependent DNA methyltransferase [Ollibium composti]|uniref:Methyltransferase domain-containing protein n=1 Tax=Ollibium composti TaxID=2675109 RepID=A0ABY2Q5C9_9HYPH|nr:methyltransferase domain-containing protein [Mesorhizobium composti]THF56269.1 methyltransferase domain-containing protein [Mesorhizobium composti]